MKLRLKSIFLATLAFSSLSILFNNCIGSSLSTEASNENMDGGTGIGNPMSPFSSKLASAACTVLTSCHPEISRKLCEDSLLASSGLDYQIGLPTGRFESFKSVMAAEEQGRLAVRELDLNRCAERVSQLSCDSPQTEGAFVAGQENPFWGLPRLFLHDFCSQAINVKSHLSTDRLHYIRSKASGRGDGSDWANACPGFTGPCGGNSMQRGHTYYVAAGDYDAVIFDVPGTDLITVKKATSGDHGTDDGWLDAYGIGPAVFPGWEFKSSHWVLDGQSRSSLSTGHGFQINLPRLSPNCPVKFCNAVLLHSNSRIDRVTLRFVEVVGFGVESNRHLNGFYSVPIDGISSNIVLYGLSMHDFPLFNGNSPIKTAGKGVINLTFENSAVFRSKARVLSDSGSGNVSFKNNWIENVGDQAILFVYGNGTSKNWLVSGNVFWESNPDVYGISNGAVVCTQINCVDWRITNNTFAGFSGVKSNFSHINFDYAGSESSENWVMNNIWFQSNRVASGGTGLVTGYNMYLSSTHAPSESFGVIGDFDPFKDSKNGNFHLLGPTAPGRSFPDLLHLDRDGQERGADGNWDRGSFEF